MPTNTKPTIPELLEEWEGMSQRERDAAVAETVGGWERVELFDRVINLAYFATGEGSMYSEGPKVPYLVRPGRMAEGDDMVIAREQVGDLVIGGDQDLPAYTSEDSPRSLVSDLEQKTIEDLGFWRWWNAFFELSKTWSEPGFPAHAANLARATADQRCCACWIAKRMAAQGGEG